MTNIYERKIESCSPSSDLVAYLYDELNAAESEAFEKHLAECERCTSEFAELSFARLGVYEWHRDEFANMATPHFTIPYEAAAEEVSWLHTLRGYWAANRYWGAAGGTFALFAVVFGAVMITSTMSRDAEVNIVTNERDGNSAQPKSAVLPNVPQAAQAMESPAVVPGPSREGEPEFVRAGVKPKTVNNGTKRPVRNADPVLRRSVPTQARKAPRLNDFEDEVDNTLRLGDLLADVDSK